MRRAAVVCESSRAVFASGDRLATANRGELRRSVGSHKDFLVRLGKRDVSTEHEGRMWRIEARDRTEASGRSSRTGDAGRVALLPGWRGHNQ